MIFDSDAVKQLVRNYHGFYLLKEKSSGDVLHYGSEVHSCNLEVDCQTGQITVNLRDGEQQFNRIIRLLLREKEHEGSEILEGIMSSTRGI